MRETIKRYRTIVYTIGIALSIFFAVYLYFSLDFNFNTIVEETLKKYAGLNVTFKKLRFTKLGIIELNEVTLKDKNGKTLVMTPVLILKYDKKSLSQITEIKVKKAKINFEMYGDYSINFVDAFKSEEADKESQSILKKIVVEDSTFYYRDTMNPIKIEKKLNLSNGVIVFGNNSEISINADATDDKEVYKFRMDYINKDKYEIGIKLNNIPINNKYMQYAFTSKDIDYIKGIADLDLKIEPHGNLKGSAEAKECEVKYSELSENVENGTAKIEFKGRVIEVKAEGNIGKKNRKITIVHSLEDKNTNISMKLENINTEEDKNIYKPIKELELDVKGNIENLGIDINVNSKKETKVKIIYSAKELKYNNIKILNLSGEVNYYNDKIKLIENKVTIEDYGSAVASLEGIIKEKTFKGKYTLKSIENKYLKIKELEGKIDYNSKDLTLNITGKSNEILEIDSKIDIKRKRVEGRIESNGAEVSYESEGIKFYGDINYGYDIKNENLTMNINGINGSKVKYSGKEIEVLAHAELKIDIEEKKIVEGSGNLKAFNINGIDEISTELTIDKNYINIENCIVKKGESLCYLKGYYSIGTGKYTLNIENADIAISDISNNKEYLGKLSAEGIISGNGFDDAEGMIEINSKEGELGEISYKGISASVNIIYNNENLRVNGIGEIQKGVYKNEILEDINFNVRYKDNIVYIDNMYNNSLTLKGYYNIISGNMNFDLGVRKYKIENISLIKERKIRGYLESLSAKIEGEKENPRVTVDVKNLMLSYDMYRNTLFNGIIFYKEGELSFENFKVNQNSITGKYNLKDGEIEAKVNIFENNMSRYAGIKELKIRTIGEVLLWGNVSDLKASGNISCDNIVYKEKKMPNVAVKFTYNKGDINNISKSGIVNFSAIDIFTSNKEKIVSGKGYIDFEKEKIEFGIDDYNIDISSIEYVKAQTNNNVAGNLKLNFELSGTFDNFNYTSSLKSYGLKIYDNEVSGIDVKIKGNKEEVVLEKADISYSGNRFYARGNLNYTPLKYNFNLNGNNINLNILNIFAKGKLKNLSGKADANLSISNDNSAGSLILKNLAFESEDNSIKVSNLNVTTSLEQNKIKIYELTANVNEGSLKGSGDIALSEMQIEKFDLKEFKAKTWDLNLVFNNIRYDSSNFLTLYLDGNITAKDKIVRGNVAVKNGVLRGIPEWKKENETGKIEVPKDINLVLDIMLDKSFKVNINKYYLIEGFEANLEGNGILKVENGNVNFLGTISTEKGVIEFNKNLFEIESGVIVFDDPLQFYPEINPSIAIKAVTDVANEEINVGITGYLKKPNIMLTSGSNLENEDIVSLLAFHKTLVDTTPKGVIKDILERQLGEEIFNPISQKISKTLGIKKVKIGSNILEDSDEELKFTKDLRLGASVEVGDKLYKDIIFWNAKAKLSDKIAGNMDSFNLWLDYKVFEWLSLSGGVEKKSDSTEDDNPNMHIGLEINKKFDFNF